MNLFTDPRSPFHWKRCLRIHGVYWMMIFWGRQIDMELWPRVIVALAVTHAFDYWWRHRSDDDDRWKRKRRKQRIKDEWAKLWTWLAPKPATG